MKYLVRSAQSTDAAGISRVILSALWATNAQDYSEDVIARVAQNFSPENVSTFLNRRSVFVAMVGDDIAGTASLDGQIVKSVFVSPDYQGRSIGRTLMARLEDMAVERGLAVLKVSSSITAEAFYSKVGFCVVRHSFHGEERTIVMERILSEVRQSCQTLIVE